MPTQTPRGRGAFGNIPNRFEPIEVERDQDAGPSDEPSLQTKFYKDSSKTVLAYNDSPDLSFSASLNPYRGCEHGCSYCYARPTHEYLGFSSGLDFESRIMVKQDAPELLRKELSKKGWKPQTIVMSGVTDAYQPVERRLKLTRRCLEVLAEFRNPVSIVTKNHLVARDADILSAMAKHEGAAVMLSVTTLDPALQRVMEPRASHPRRRLEAVAALAEAGVPVGVMVAPVIPAVNDPEIPAILDAAAKAGARFAAYVPLRLPFGVKDIFEAWLERHFPERKKKVLNQIRSLRGGRLNDPDFGSRFQGQGAYAAELESLFRIAYRKAGLGKFPALSTRAFRRPAEQPLLFEGA